MSFDIRRATKDQLDKINAEIKAGKSGKNYTVHKSGGQDFILVESGAEREVMPEPELETQVLEVDPLPLEFESPCVQKLSRHIKADVIQPETTKSGERAETCLEFNFEAL
jgi:hypothetical protein